ncbi:MAG: TonB-dependent receptor [Deltaproteobacteria bacterium]|jgi:iron complex outermembrane receptor protein|nr:TonB-dependent receptor [Deltaproteobacteria bacterium]
MRKKRWFASLLVSAVVGLFFFTSTALADETAAKQNDPKLKEDEASVTLREIDVRGTVRREELESTSATVLGNEDVVGRVYNQPLDMITLSPGISITQYGESGVAPAFKIRGFSAGHGTGDVTMYLDGIPLHDNGHATGYLDTGMIMPIEIESMEIIKGPASVYYGQRAAGGALPIQTIKGGDRSRLNLRYGSNNNIDTAALLARDDGKLSQVYAFEIFHTDGWRNHSDWNKQNGSGRWSYVFSDNFTASLNLRAYNAQWDSAGYLPRSMNLDPKEAVDDGSGQYNGGKRDRYDGRLWGNLFLSERSQLTAYAYGTTLEHTRWQLGNMPTIHAPAPTTGSEQWNEHNSYGSGLTYNYKGAWAERDATLTLGMTYSKEAEDRRRWRLPWGTGRVRGSKSEDVSFDIMNTGLLGEATWQILQPLNLRLGGRYDFMGGEYDNHMAAAGAQSHFKAPGYKEFSPKAGLVYTPLERINIFMNYGHGFSMPGLSATQYYSGNAYDLTKRDQYELGSRAAVTDWMDLEISYYRIYTRNDITYDATTNTNEPIGKTRRYGLENSITLRPLSHWRLHANYTWQEAYNINNGTATVDNSGRRITTVPRHIANAEMAYLPPEGLGGRLKWRWEGSALLRDVSAVQRDGITPNPAATPNRVKAKNISTVDLQLHYRFNDNIKLVFDILNLMDQENYGSQGAPNAFGDFTYSMQPPRTFYLGFDIDW